MSRTHRLYRSGTLLWQGWKRQTLKLRLLATVFIAVLCIAILYSTVFNDTHVYSDPREASQALSRVTTSGKGLSILTMLFSDVWWLYWAGLPHQDVQYTTQRYFMSSSYTAHSDNDITLATQLTLDRLNVMTNLVKAWGGPISAAFYISNTSHPRQELERLRRWHSSDVLIGTWVDVHILVSAGPNVPKTVEGYPINSLRNLAQTSVRTDYVFMIDADFLPSANLKRHLKKAFLGDDTDPQKTTRVIIVPIFAGGKYQEHALNKQQLLQAEVTGEITPFSGSYRATNYDKWRQTQAGVYRVEYEDGFEPYYCGAVDWLPLYSEALRGPSQVKYAHAWTVNAMKFGFYVLAQGFMVHQPHKHGRGGSLLSPRALFVRNRYIWETRVQPEILKQLGDDFSRRKARVQQNREARHRHIQQANTFQRLSNQLRSAESWQDKFQRHAVLQAAMVAGEVAPRYVFVQTNTASGLGNRFLTLISAYILAVLSERALLVDWPNHKQSLIHTTSGESIAMVPLHRLVDTSVLQGVVADVSSLEGLSAVTWRQSTPGKQYDMVPMFYNSRQNLDMDAYNSASQNVLCVGCNAKWGALLCGNINYHFVQQYIVIPNSWDFFAPLVLENAYYKDSVANNKHKHRNDGIAIATEASIAHLLQPDEEIQHVIDNFRAANFQGKFVIGLHIRRKGMNFIGMFGDELILHDFRTCAEYVALEHNINNLPVYFYISTDSPRVFDVIGNSFPKDRVLQSPYSQFHGRDTEKGIQGGVIDLWLLGESDQVIQSDGSTFSQFAASRKRHKIFTMGVDGQCSRPLRTAPCNFEWGRIAEYSRCDAQGNYLQQISHGRDWHPRQTHGHGKCALFPLGRLSHEHSIAKEANIPTSLRDSWAVLQG